MHKSELNPNPILAVPTIPVICEKCRAEGRAGDPAFAAIPDILAFTPVPRRAHANNWTAEHQRAFIAALAMTGSPRQAARAIGRHAFGAEQLRKAKGGLSFAEAWDAALELARERELVRIRETLGALAAEEAEKHAQLPPEKRLQNIGRLDPDDELALERQAAEAAARIRNRLLGARRHFLKEIEPDIGKRAAFEFLCGAVDWEAAATLEAQPDEPFRRTNMRAPEMWLPAEHGWLGEVTATPDHPEDKHAEFRFCFEHFRKTGDMPSDEEVEQFHAERIA